jgi:DNA-binding HxlR family transcriptional regulator
MLPAELRHAFIADGEGPKALADALKRLERNGLITRMVLRRRRSAWIIPLGLSLQQPFEALYGWAVEYGAEVKRAQTEYDAGA